MRIIQLIDSLEAGGAERIAVNYANTLHFKIEISDFSEKVIYFKISKYKESWSFALIAFIDLMLYDPVICYLRKFKIINNEK